MHMSDDTPEVTSSRARKPRLVLMGEFSAGKSTLSNMLLGSSPLPMRVTATRLPPVQISYGEPGAYAVDMQGERHQIDLDHLEDVSLDETQSIELTMIADALRHCDLVDMPGVSDPSMHQQYWEDIVEPDDHVIWCTHATQAWRQSEAAIWKILQPQTSGTNLLLITQFDKLQNDRDKQRVVKRIERETDGLFDAIYPVSLLAALRAGTDAQAWEASGAAVFSEHLVKMLSEATDTMASEPADIARGFRGRSKVEADTTDDATEPAPELDSRVVTPRRVRLRSARVARDRPSTANVIGMNG